MDSLVIPILLLLVSLVLYTDEVTEEEPNWFRAAVYVSAMLFACFNLNLIDAAG